MTPGIERLFEAHREYLYWGPQEGSWVREGRLLLGNRAGPECSADTLLHEMAHLVDIDDDRCTSRNWGLAVPEVEVNGRVYSEPQTFQASERELQVLAIQKVLADLAGIKMSLTWWGSVLSHMPDWWAFCDYFDDSEDVRFQSPEWLGLIVADLRRRRRALDLAEVEDEWHRKAAIVRDTLAQRV